MTVRVKVCGFTRAEDVQAALDAGVDAIGLNLARGPRRIELGHAAGLAALVPPLVTAVALFVDATEDAILQAMRVTRCSAVQLHGDEPAELAERLREWYPVIKAFRVGSAADVLRIRGYPADAYLLDAQVTGLHGGTGVGWDHRWLDGIDLGAPIVLAGGLTPVNIGAAVAAVRPWAVDVASGVESAAGIKDADAVRRFIAAARSA